MTPYSFRPRYFKHMTSDAIVVFILIKLVEAMIYTFLACVPVGASKFSFIKPLRTGTT